MVLLISNKFDQENMALKKIDLSWNGFGDVGACVIADALRYDTGLLGELDLTCEYRGSNDIFPYTYTLIHTYSQIHTNTLSN